MGDRAQLLNRSSGLDLEEDAPPARGRPGSRPGGNGVASQKRPAAGEGDAALPGAKKLRPSSSSSVMAAPYAAVLAQLPAEDEKQKKVELRALADKTVAMLEYPDLNYFLQAIKKAVKDRMSDQGVKPPDGVVTTAAAGAAPGAAEATANGATGGEAEEELPPGSARNKPTRTGMFYPLNNLPAEGAEKKVEPEEKAFKRAKAERRTAEEEQAAQDLLHSIADEPVMKDGALDEARFEEVLTQSLDLNKSNKHWFTLWSHCAIKGDATPAATIYFTNKLSLDKDENELGDILGHLMKEKEISPKHMEEAIQKFAVAGSGRELLKIIAWILVFIYPTQKNDFGWSRVGWGFQNWWGQCKKYLKHCNGGGEEATGESQLECIKMVIEQLVKYKAPFEEDKQEKVINHATNLAGDREKACLLLGITGDSTVKPSPSPLSNEEGA
ncbi:unnamed protein product [Amoebophrya sp. A25]|nr:unnamed protein product [Amoebophrya sp. A25]|eukprot:GSA25T00012359001.1